MWMILVAFLLGVLVGGVVNQLASDLPARRPPSKPHCPYCGEERPWRQWLGVGAYVAGRPGCPSCGAPVGLRRPLVEIGLGLVYGYLWMTVGPSVRLVFYLIYGAIFALILVTDIERRLILNVVTYPAIVVGFVGSFFMPAMTWWSALIGGGIGLAFFFLAAVIGHAIFGSGAMGGGDVKLAAFVGLITGFPLVIEAILLTILIGAAVSLVLLIVGVRGLDDHVPYGPFLVAGAVITLLWGYRLAWWFLP
ncbi:MAG: A24 family peptidase [Chloroflexota bacterium]|nr:A24 family peptidase [Chloroflexota bacterium]